MAKLKNARHERFCQEYVKDNNATQAYIRAGYSKKTAQASSSTLLLNQMVKERIKELQAKVAKKLEMSAERIGLEFMRLGFADIGDVLNEDGTLKNISKLPPDVRASIASIETDTIGKKVTKTKLRFHNKISALESLGKHIGWFEADNEQKREKEDFSGVPTAELVKRAKAIKEIESRKSKSE